MLLSNIYEIVPAAPDFSGQVLPYTKERLDELRAKHNSTYSFFRHADEIVAIWMEGKREAFGESRRIVWEESTEICHSATRHLLFRTFIRKLPGRTPLDFAPLRFLSHRKEHDLIRDALPPELQDIATYKRLIELDVRRLARGGGPVLGVTVNIDQFWGLSLNASQMVEQGFDLKGRLATESKPIPGLAALIAQDESIIGEVESATPTTVVVRDSGQTREVSASSVHLRRWPYDILDFIEHRAGRQTRMRVEDAWRRTPPLSSNPSELLAEQTSIAEYLNQWEFEAASGMKFRVHASPMPCEGTLALRPTMFRFDPTPGATNQKPASGLFKHGPYDARRFTPKTPNFLVVCDPAFRAGFASFAHSLENGVPDSRYFQRGLRDLYSLQGMNWHFLEVPIDNTERLQTTIRTHLQQARVEYSLAFLQGDEGLFESAAKDSAYYTAKASLMAAGIPVQAVQPHRTRLKGGDLGDILGNLALQVYAKMGGTPWTVESSGSVDHEIVIGVGHNLERTSARHSSRVVGITTVFSSDGTFLVSRTTNAVAYDAYFDTLLEELTQTIETLSRDYAWRDGASVRIVFHVFKPMRMIEVDVVGSLIKRFSRYDILFAFVTIALEHPFLLYESQSADTRGPRRVTAPDRLKNAVLDRHAALIHLRGASQRIVAKHGYPRASLVKIHPSSTFTDLHYIVQQIVDFSHLSWRTFFPSYIPVTVHYSNLIAEMLQHLGKVPGWNAACLAGPLRRKKWFL